MPNQGQIKNKKLALVVDDSVMQCKMLSILLEEENYRVISANDGASGVKMYIKYQPDLILMDINMPIMNGYEAARNIKSLTTGDTLAPLIFITSMDTDQAFIDSIDAGGDGILTRPFSPEVFKAKIKSIQRISDLYGQVKSLQQEQQQDAELAEQLMSGVIEARNFAVDHISIVKRAATLFSGDIQLTALCPNGDIHVLLGDFTGHGLRSSIGAIPLSETFRSMTKKGFSLFEIIKKVNSQLYDLLPHDLFLAAAFVKISEYDKSAAVFNAGLPDVYFLNAQGKIKFKLSSIHPPIGILPNLLPDTKITIRDIELDDKLILISDGIIEARNLDDEMYEYERLEKCISFAGNSNSVAKKLINDVNAFCQGRPQEDDLSIIAIPCSGWIMAKSNNTNTENIYLEELDQETNFNSSLNSEQDLLLWHSRLTLNGRKLAEVNPIPIAMNQIQEIEGSAEHWNNVYTILTELFVNAFDHGVLDLGSHIKSSAEGFTKYFTERQKRIDLLAEGSVDIKIFNYQVDNGIKLVIRIKDSGKGFNVKKVMTDSDGTNFIQLSGRGIKLVKQLATTLEYFENGTLVEASYVLQHANKHEK